MTSPAADPRPIAIASDHAGLAAKLRLKSVLAMQGRSVRDFGTDGEESVDYPDFGRLVAEAVRRGESGVGLLLCGSGLGMSYVANRVAGIRAALCWSVEVARLAREHNNANILVLPGRAATIDPLEDILAVFLETAFPDEGRHGRRIAKIDPGVAGA